MSDTRIEMTREQHQQRHVELHRMLDELLADYMRHHPEQLEFLAMPVQQLVEWSHKQTLEPTELKGR